MPVLSKIHPVKCCDFANRQRFPVCFSQFSVIFPEFQRNNTPEGGHRTMSPSRTTRGRERTQATPTTTMCSWLLVPPYTFRVVPRTLSKSTVRTGRPTSLERCTICRSPNLFEHGSTGLALQSIREDGSGNKRTNCPVFSWGEGESRLEELAEFTSKTHVRRPRSRRTRQ